LSLVFFLAYACSIFLSSFLFPATSTPEIYTLSLHDALPISECETGRADGVRVDDILEIFDIGQHQIDFVGGDGLDRRREGYPFEDRKSTRLNSSHEWISYAVFCLKEKKQKNQISTLKKLTLL